MRQSCHTVPVETDLSSDEFLHEYVLARRPVVIRGALSRWNAMRWDLGYLKAKVGARRVRYRTERQTETGGFGELLDRIFTGDAGPYLRNIDIGEQLPELVGDITPQPVYSQTNWRSHVLMPSRWPAAVKKGAYELFVSPAAAAFPYLHIDYWGMSAFFAQVCGEKEVVLFPPDDAPNLYPTANDPLVSEVTNFDDVDTQRYPKLQAAKQHRITLRAGDLLFNPAWWHTTRTTQTAITVIWAYWNQPEWLHLLAAVRETGGLRGRLLAAYLRFVGVCNRYAGF